MYVRCLILVADRLAGVDRFLGGKRSLCQVQLLLPPITERQLPGLEQDAWLPIGQHLVGGDNSITPGTHSIKLIYQLSDSQIGKVEVCFKRFLLV